MRFLQFGLMIGVFSLVAGFAPFSPVTNVCPDCSVKGVDVVKLRDGQLVSGFLVAQCQDGVVVSRNGERRFLGAEEIERTTWKDGQQRTLRTLDVVVLNNGVVFVGRIEQEVAGRYLTIATGQHTVTVWMNQIAGLYRRGVPDTTFQQPGPGGGLR